MALAMLKTSLLCRPGGVAGKHQIQTKLFNHWACGASFLSCRAAHGSSHAQQRPVVQASRAAGQHQMQRTLLNHWACGAGLFSCRAATHGSSHAGLLCRPGEVAGQYQVQRTLLKHGACGVGLFCGRAANHGFSHAQNRLAVQAWGACLLCGPGGGFRTARNTVALLHHGAWGLWCRPL